MTANGAYQAENTIRMRRSVRTYADRQLDPATLGLLRRYIDGLTNPFGADVKIGILQKQMGDGERKLGTYGLIKGASTFLCLMVAPGERAFLGAGYAFEDLLLYATHLGLGTVWLAATFSRPDFVSELDLPDGFHFPAISPVGYTREKRFVERIMRNAIGSDRRKPWREIFFDGDFDTPLTVAGAGEYATPLEMLRLAPSAVNAQPWRVVKIADTFHFYVSLKNNASLSDVNIKHLDMGIAICHFVKTLGAAGRACEISFTPPRVVAPASCRYVASLTVGAAGVLT